tara:strand:- start:33 stop:296 length:264 start_codon:yes stop_codon:yes gene_type:complete
MGKKRSRAHQVSKGERDSVNKSLRKAMRLEYRSSDTRIVNQLSAWRAGKNVMLTITNPDKKNTKERMIRVPAIEYWGYPRQMSLKMR